MAGPHIFTVFICLIIVSNTLGYNILNRIENKLDKDRMLFNRTSVHSTFNYDDCIPVQAVKELACSLGEKYSLYHDLFESVCRQHRLCYKCGMLHGLTAEKCDILSIRHIYRLCLKNLSSKSDCLKKRLPALKLLQQDIYRTYEFSIECYDRCILNYLYSAPHPE